MAKKTKAKVVFACKECGFEHPKWQGQCNGCKLWNTLVEFEEQPLENINLRQTVAMAGGSSKPASLEEISEEDYPGFSTGLKELDRVLGGKLAQDQVVLLAAEPGTGKSTLLLQSSANIANTLGDVLYCTGEESQKQIRNRAKRLGITAPNLFIYNTENILEIIKHVDELKPSLLVVDSIQHIYNPEEKSSQGSVSQIQSCASTLVTLAKTKNIPILIIGHVNKDDSIAGPRKLEHIVDTILFLESDKNTGFRVITSIKNRYGDTTEVGVFKMEERGMVEITNPSEYLIANRANDDSGSAIVCTTGKRPMLIEVQALVVKTNYENAIPRRTSRGFERDRFNILTAVLEKKCGITLGNKDIYLNVVGGVKIDEPGTDLGIAMAIVSSDKDIVLHPSCVMIGEIGLAGEVRPVSNIEGLVKEAEKNGFEYFVLPNQNLDQASRVAKKIKLLPVTKLNEAIKVVTKLKK